MSKKAKPPVPPMHKVNISIWRNLCRAIGCYLIEHNLRRVTIEVYGTQINVTIEPK